MMIDQTMQEILAETKLMGAEADILRKVLAAVESGAGGLGISLEPGRWLAIGVHLAAAIKRAKIAEALPEIDAAMLEQISPEMQALSRQILMAIEEIGTTMTSLPEIILLAVHLQCAKDGF